MSTRKILVIAAIGAFAASLFLPATAGYTGVSALIAGIFSWLTDPLWGLAWTSNFLLFAGIMLGFLAKKPKAPMIVAGIGIVLCCVSFLPEDIMVNEGGGKDPSVLGLGFYLWLSSHVLLFASTFFYPKAPSPQESQQFQ